MDGDQVEWPQGAQEAGSTCPWLWDLERDGFAVSSQEFRQVFEPYMDPEMPVFITTDSVLSAFHVLFEQTLGSVEQGNACRLEALLSVLLERLPAVARRFDCGRHLVEAARRRATIVVAASLRLCGATAQRLGLDAATSQVVEQEVARAEAATECLKPAWLGPPDLDFEVIDYTHFRPRGFYSQSPLLQRYFRAVAFLQAIPMRVNVDEELVSFLMLASCLEKRQSWMRRLCGGSSALSKLAASLGQGSAPPGSGSTKADEVGNFLVRFRTALGVSDSWDLDVVSRFGISLSTPCRSEDLETIRQLLFHRHEATEEGGGGRASAEIVDRPKSGMRVPAERWLQEPLLQEARQRLLDRLQGRRRLRRGDSEGTRGRSPRSRGPQSRLRPAGVMMVCR